MRRAVLIAIPFALAVPVAYGWAFAQFGHEPMLGPVLAGAAGWTIALDDGTLRAAARPTRASPARRRT
jgi:hypothetical protein